MAFYPDELSPIDRIRSLGKQADSLPDIGPLKNRRQWKSLVLGKKDMGMNNFATIAEEKEEEMSSDGSQGASSNTGSASGFAFSPGAASVATAPLNKKITFPKPRKYITSRVSDNRKEDPCSKPPGASILFSSSEFPDKGLTLPNPDLEPKKTDLLNIPSAPSTKPSAPDMRQQPKSGKSKEFIAFNREFVQNYALSETPMESQWNDAFSDGVGLASSLKPSHEKLSVSKLDSDQGLKSKQEEKRKSSGSSKSSVPAEVARRGPKGGKKKRASPQNKSPKSKEEVPSSDKAPASKGKQKMEKGKALNMKEVVNVYKNLAYGSKEEIKSFVENLSFVKDESRAESDKNLLSMMNLKALENKIKNFAKKSGKNQELLTPKEKSVRVEKQGKKNRKAHIERLARHKVVKIPAAPSSNHQTNPGRSADVDQVLTHKEKAASAKDKEPWKYVGMESILNKTYFVYPAYPPSINLKNAAKTRKAGTQGTGKPGKQKKGSPPAAAPAPKTSEPKVKGPSVVLKPNPTGGGGARSHFPNASGPSATKAANRSSAMTVCTVKFWPAVGQQTEEPPVGAADQSLLVYLHGTKAIHVKSPYSDKQFSRVKFFRKDERGMPLIKGIGRRAPPKGRQTVSVRNISLPGKLDRVRSLDLLDFDEDIQNITDFLRSQESPDRRRQEEWQGLKKTEREWWPKESSKEPDAATSRRQRRQRRPAQDLHLHHHARHHHHRHHHHPLHQREPPPQGTVALSPNSIINEISKNIQHLQYLPDTEDNRKMIGQFFDDLDQRIEASRNGTLSFQQFLSPPGSDAFGPIPILGY